MVISVFIHSPACIISWVGLPHVMTLDPTLRSTHSSSDRTCLESLFPGFLCSLSITEIHKHRLVSLYFVGKLTVFSLLYQTKSQQRDPDSYPSVILHLLPKPHCRTCSFCYFQIPLLPPPPPLFPTSARSEHRSRIITPQRNLSVACHLIFFLLPKCSPSLEILAVMVMPFLVRSVCCLISFNFISISLILF